jgi:hypothetical protein
MANTFGNPIVIDTAGASSTVLSNLWVLEIRWVGATTPAHEATITDPTSGQFLWGDIAPGANYVSETTRERTWKNGFTVPTLGSGKLYITIG